MRPGIENSPTRKFGTKKWRGPTIRGGLSNVRCPVGGNPEKADELDARAGKLKAHLNISPKGEKKVDDLPSHERELEGGERERAGHSDHVRGGGSARSRKEEIPQTA